MPYFADAIRLKRQTLGLSEEQLAQRCRLDVLRLRQLERASVAPTTGEAQALSRALDLPLNVLRDLVHFDRDGLKPTGVPKA